MIKNIIFDFGGVLVDWNPHYLYDPWFGDAAKTDWFLTHICNMEWNTQMDAGKPIAQGTAELVAQHPGWETEIRMYYGQWIKMMSPNPIPGMYDYVVDLKCRGYKVYGLSNWSAETFCQVRHVYPVFDLLDGMVVSGYEGVVKPDARIYRLLLDRFGLNAHESVFIDDNAANVEGARRMGMQSLRFTTKEALEGPLESLLAEN